METGISALLHLVGHLLPGQVLWFTLATAAVVVSAIATGAMQRLFQWIELGTDRY